MTTSTTVAHYLDLATILNLFVGFFLPTIVGAVTKVTTHPALKGLALAVLSGAAAVIAQWIDALNSHTPFLWQSVVLSAFMTYVVAQAAHTSFWRNTPLSSSGTPFLQPPAKPVIDVVPAAVHDDVTDLGDLSDLTPGTPAA